MAVYYYNGDKILAPFSIISNKPVFASDTVSLKHIRSAQTSQRWEISFNTVNSGTAADALLNLLTDMDQASTMIIPQLPEVDSSSTATGTATVLINSSTGNSVLELDTSLASGFLPKGSFISFESHSKVYLLQNDLDFDNELDTVIASIYPNLTVETSSGSVVNYGANCSLHYYRDINSTQGITFSDGVLANQGTVTLIEALQ